MTMINYIYIVSHEKNRENHGLKTMGPKPWVQNDEPKTMDVDYSRSLTKSLFYFILLFGSTMIDIYIGREKIMGPKP